MVAAEVLEPGLEHHVDESYLHAVGLQHTQWGEPLHSRTTQDQVEASRVEASNEGGVVYVDAVLMVLDAVEEKVAVDLWSQQQEVEKDDHQLQFHILVHQSVATFLMRHE